MHVLAPAKINLHLRVGKRRDDGFHPLLTWMCTVGLFDKLTITPSSTPSFTCNWLALSADNLVLKALQALPPLPPLS
ncbi:MAG TPA: hypothetical protein VFE58_16500, partial [Tepidisphaeraceae bacterium]|nr:hypothetical protein [Tepidisphaeraceae bacterium]